MTKHQVIPPRAERRPVRTTLHGITLEDPYAWLKDPHWAEVMRDPDRLDPAIRAHLEAENAYLEVALAPSGELRARLFEELKGRIKEDDSTVPSADGAYAYYRKYVVGGEHPVFCRSTVDGGAEEILLDGNREAEGHAFFRVGNVQHSPEHSLLAYAVDTKGAEAYTIRFKDLAADEVLDTRIEQAHGPLAWGAGGRTLYYTVLDERHRPLRVYRHRMGGDPKDDELIFEEANTGFFVSVGATLSKRFVVIATHDHTTSEMHLLDAEDPEARARLVAPRERDVEYHVRDCGERLIILTNADGAEDFKIVEAPLAAPGRENWRDVVPHRAGCLIRRLEVFRRHMVWLQRVEGLPSIVIRAFESGEDHEIAFREEAYELGLEGEYDYDTSTLRFSYSSMATPLRIYDYDMETRERALRKEQEIPSGHDPEAYVTRRLRAVSHDGEEVPISLVHRKDTPIDGSAPCLLYGYGSYGVTMPASFAANRFSLIDRGFVYAIAHVRGGTARGYRWYLDGKGLKKKNTFLDFIAAAETLVAEGYASAGRIAISGGSAGGMLVGACANMRPDLWKAVVAEVPFVDVLNTMCDADLPLTPPEWPEWGNPIADPEAFRYIYSYSPYENVEEKAYPHILATAGLSDPRVTYWEPAKWVARLRARKTDRCLLLLKTNMSAGHAGAAGRFEKLQDVALAYGFLLQVFDRMTPEP